MNMMLIDTAPIKEQLDKAEAASRAYGLEIANVAVLLRNYGKDSEKIIESLSELKRVFDLAADRLENLNGRGHEPCST